MNKLTKLFNQVSKAAEVVVGLPVYGALAVMGIEHTSVEGVPSKVSQVSRVKMEEAKMGVHKIERIMSRGLKTFKCRGSKLPITVRDTKLVYDLDENKAMLTKLGEKIAKDASLTKSLIQKLKSFNNK